MKIIVKPAFDLYVDKLRERDLKIMLDEKIIQIENAKSII